MDRKQTSARGDQHHHRHFNLLFLIDVILMTLSTYAAFANNLDNCAMESITASGWASRMS
jgi:hypothetical protein